MHTIVCDCMSNNINTTVVLCACACVCIYTSVHAHEWRCVTVLPRDMCACFSEHYRTLPIIHS